tara:strand:- start:6424 stop:7164 length:741 start_codon:yes stop_codon:yes gene_type:complete
MIFFIAPSGGNNNYICMQLLKKKVGEATTYHDAGSHSEEKEIINFMHIENKTKSTRIVITQDYNNIKNLVTEEDIVIQNYIDKHREMLLLNWFHKNIAELGDNPALKYGWRDSWIKWQTDLWKPYSKIPVATAVAEWLYKLKDDNFEDIKRIPAIDKVFNWSVMYDSPQATVDEFQKIGYTYTIEDHNKWLGSQEDILAHWLNVKNNINDPLSLQDDVHKGIALGLNGLANGLTRKAVEQKFQINL